MALRVAVIGVRGVGKFHAQWFAHEGAQVVAFVASSPETLNANETALRQVVPDFAGRGYADVAEMLQRERPDAVSVCSPHHLHAEHALLALRHGAHVLCEKPLVWLGEDRMEEALALSQQVVAEAERLRRQFAINTQYVAAVPHLRSLWAQRFSSLPPCVRLTMEARMRERDTSGVGLWVDLAPHPISLLLALFPDAKVRAETATFDESANALTAHFSLPLLSGEELPVTLRVARLEGALERSIAWGDFLVRFEAHRDERGIFHTRLCFDDGERIVDDFMRVSIRRFLQAVEGKVEPLCDGAMALRQMEWLIALLRCYLRQ
jgi:predicted dehydrogenase